MKCLEKKILSLLILAYSMSGSLSAETQGLAGLPPIAPIRTILKGTDSQPGSLFGFSSAVSGNTVVVVSPGFGCDIGGAYVFVEPQGGWQRGVATQTAKLTGSDFGTCDGSGFGEVGISGDTIVAGPGPQGRSIYVFVKPSGGWHDMTETARLTTSKDLYGLMGLAISGNTVVGGYPLAFGNQIGAAAVFVEPQGGWSDETQAAILRASESHNNDQLGTTVAIQGNTVVSGAPNVTVGGVPYAGSLYVYERPPSGWRDATQNATLSIKNPTNGTELGLFTSFSGTTIASTGLGVNIFVEPTGGWTDMTETAQIQNMSGSSSNAVAISGNVIVSGDTAWPAYPTYYGAMFAYVKPADGWQNTATPNADFEGQPSGGAQQIGYSVAVDGHTVVTGAAWFGGGRGIAYLFSQK